MRFSLLADNAARRRNSPTKSKARTFAFRRIGPRQRTLGFNSEQNVGDPQMDLVVSRRHRFVVDIEKNHDAELLFRNQQDRRCVRLVVAFMLQDDRHLICRSGPSAPHPVR